LLGDLELLLLLVFSEAQPSFIFSWLSSNGYTYKATNRLIEFAKQDEMNGSREALKTLLYEKIQQLRLNLEIFSKKSETLMEIFTLTLLTAPIMLYSLGIFQPWLLPQITIVLMALNMLILMLYSNLYPRELRVMKLPRKMLPIVLYPALVTPIAKTLFPEIPLEKLLLIFLTISIPASILIYRETRQITKELQENLEILVKVSSSPFHVFSHLDPKLLKKDTKTELSKTVRIAVYLLGLWGTEKRGLAELKNIYEEILKTLKEIRARGTISALSNLVSLFLLGFSSSLITQLLSTLASRDMLASLGIIIDPAQLYTWIELYLIYASIVYTLGLALLSLGSPSFYPLWLPLSILTTLAGLISGKKLLGW
jgi:hypothetical protein